MALIDASMLDSIFEGSMPFSRDPNERFLLDIDGVTIVIDAGILKVGQVGSTNLAPGAVGPSSINFTSSDVPHSSPNIAAIDVHDALEEVALGYIGCLPLSGGAMSGDIDMSGNEITGLSAATDPTDALNLASGELLIREGHFFRPPVGFAGTAVPGGALKPGWIRATGSLYLSALPIAGDTVSINGVTLTFAVTGGPNLIEIGPDVATTVLNAVSEINANTTITLDGTPLNSDVYAIQDAGLGTALHLVVTNEDPPNTPEDGNDKPLSVVSAVITVRGFEGGLGTVEDGTLVPDLFTNTLYIYDAMQPSSPWVNITGGGGGSVDATNVWYTGPAIPNVIGAVPDHLQNILISLDSNLGAGIIVPAAHATSHENLGADEIDVTGLSGLLADAQTPLGHGSTHEDAGSDEIDVTGLSGKLADLQDAGWLQGNPVSSAAPSPNYVLTWNGAAWAPAASSTGADYATLLGVGDSLGMSVGDVVYVSGSNAVAPADASSDSTMPCRGMVVGTGAGTVDVRTHGYVTGLAGLTPGADYYVSASAPGAITSTAPSNTGEWVQKVGWALTSSVFVVEVGPPSKIVP